MPSKQLSNPAGVWGETAQAEQRLLECVNTSAGTLTHGDVVVVDNAAGQMPTAPASISGAVTTSTSANTQLVLGVVSITGDASTNSNTVAVGGTCFVCVGGVARVRITGTVTVGTHVLQHSGTAKTAAGVATASGALGAVIGIPLEADTAKDSTNCIRAIIKTS